MSEDNDKVEEEEIGENDKEKDDNDEEVCRNIRFAFDCSLINQMKNLYFFWFEKSVSKFDTTCSN